MNKQCVNCPGATDHTTAECPVMVEASAPIDPIHSAMMLGMTPEPCEPIIEITRQAVTKLLDVVEFGDELERVEKDRLVAFVKELLAQDQPELWAMHSIGPNEVHPMVSKEEAERQAASLIALCKERFPDIPITVNVIPSPYSPLEHFEILAEELTEQVASLRKALDKKKAETPAPAAAMPPEISRDLLGKIVDEVFDGAIEDPSVIEDVYRVIVREQQAAPEVVSQQVTTAAVAPDALEQARRHLSNAIEDAEDGKTAAALPALREVAHYLAQAATPPAMDRQANEAGMHTLDAICDLFMIGKDARTHICVMTNIENTHKFANLLHAIESEFFMVPGEPDEDYPDEEPSDDYLLNCWGSTQEQYVEQFRAALPAVAKQHLIAAARDVLAERHRQVNVEGFHGFRDSHYLSYELSKAARAYIEVSWHALSNGLPCAQPKSWPWMDGFKWSDGRTMLVKAGALILAEIERLDRAEQAKQQEQQP